MSTGATYRCPDCGTEVRDVRIAAHRFTEGTQDDAMAPTNIITGAWHTAEVCREVRRKWRAQRARLIDAGRVPPPLPWETERRS